METKKVLPPILFLIISTIFLEVFYGLDNLLGLIAQQADDIKQQTAYIATAISVLMYGKLRFWDTRIFSKIQQTYGKTKFTAALLVVIDLLEYLDPEELVSRLIKSDKMDIQMHGAVVELREMLQTKKTKPRTNKPIKIPRSKKKSLTKEIKNLLLAIDRRIDIHYLSKEITGSKKNPFDETMKKVIRRKDRFDAADKKLKAKGLETVTKNFSPEGPDEPL